MKTTQIEINMWEKGDYVITPAGVGEIVEDEPEVKTSQDLRDSEVLVQHKSGYSENTNNKPIYMEREIPHPISEEEYEGVQKKQEVDVATFINTAKTLIEIYASKEVGWARSITVYSDGSGNVTTRDHSVRAFEADQPDNRKVRCVTWHDLEDLNRNRSKSKGR